VVRKPDTIIQPREIPKEPPPEAEPPPDTKDEGVEGGVVGGVAGGVVGGVLGGTLGGVVGGPAPAKRIEIDDSHVKLTKLSGPNPKYTEKAIEKEIEGTMLVKCVVSTEGAVNNCRVLKTLPFMDRAVIDALEHWRFKPYVVDGKPVEVDYTFRITLKLGD
jgi:protein TonB